MNRNQIRDIYKKMTDKNLNPNVIDFAEHIARITRINTLQEVKEALAKLQDKNND